MSAWQRRECRASATTPVEGDECRDVTGGMCESACRAGKRFLVSGLRCLVSKATRDRFAQVVPTAAVSSSSGGFERLPLPLSIYINIHIKIAFSRFALETEAGLPPCPSENVILVSTGGCLSLESGARTFVVSYNSECVVLPAWGKGGSSWQVIYVASPVWSGPRPFFAWQGAPQFSHFEADLFGHLFNCFRVPDRSVPCAKKVLAYRKLFRLRAAIHLDTRRQFGVTCTRSVAFGSR